MSETADPSKQFRYGVNFDWLVADSARRGVTRFRRQADCTYVEAHTRRAKSQNRQDVAHKNLPTRHSSEVLDNWPLWVRPIMKIDAVRKKT